MRTFSVGEHGAKLLLVHGYNLCGAFYLPLAHALAARGLRTSLVTLPGFHREPPLATPSWSALTDALLDSIDPADPPALLVGHSMGGLLALCAAARRPPWLRGLALLEPAIFPNALVARAAAWRYQRRVVDAGAAMPFDNFNGGMKRIHALDRYPDDAIELFREVAATSDLATGRALFSSLPSLFPLPTQAVAGPTLIVSGQRSGLLSAWMARTLMRTLQARRVIVPDAAHWLVHEQDEAVADALAAFALSC